MLELNPQYCKNQTVKDDMFFVIPLQLITVS